MYCRVFKEEIRMDYFINHITKLNDCITTGHIVQAILYSDPNHSKTYIILGRPGPTGKTWLQRKLTELGYAAIEISEEIALSQAVEYTDYRNHIIETPSGATVIILNQWID